MSNIKTHNNSKKLNECRIIEKFSSQKRVYRDTSIFSFTESDSYCPKVYVTESEVSIMIKITTWWQNKVFHDREGL